MLKRKMLRDILDYRVQFISIFLMAFIGVLVFTGMYVDTASFETSIDDYYEETNLADGWIYSNYLVDEFEDIVYHLGATNQLERQLVIDSRAILDNSPDIKLHFVENNTISKFYLIEGKPLDISDSEGVWLDKSFADAKNLKIGDEISFESNGTQIKKTIRGLGYSPEYVYNSPVATTVPDPSSTGFAYMSHKAFPSDNITYNVLNVKFDGTPETYLKLLDYRLSGYYSLFLQRSNHYSVDVVAESISQQNSLTGVFPLIFIVVSMLMLLTTMKRIISHQRTQIGILKANGFQNYRIIIHYLSYGFIFVTAGSILGALIGPTLFHMIANPSRIFYFKFPYWHSVGLLPSLLIVCLMGAISLIVPYYSMEQIISESPSVTIKPKAPKSSDSKFVEKFKFWKKLSFTVRWNYRNVKTNKFRVIMTVCGVIGCTVLLISGFGLYEQMDESKDWYFNDINHFESKIIIEDNLNISQINSIAQKVDGVPITELSMEVFNNKTAMASLLAMDNTNLITMTDDNHEKIEISDNEVSISKRMAEIMGIKVGDTLDCRVVGSDKNVKIKIDKMHSSPFSQGLVMSPAKLKQLGLNYNPTSIVTSQHVTEKYDGTSVIYLNDMITGWDKMEETSMMIIFALIFFAVILALVVLYNLNVMYYTEMKKDMATLKVFGFKSEYLTNLLSTQSMYLTVFGFLLGIPIAYFVLSIVLPAFGDNFYMLPSISLKNLAITFIIIMSTSLIMNMFFSHKIKDMDMADSIKSLER